MADSEKTVLDAIAKLTEKVDAYDKRLTVMGSNISNVQS
jgi:hypothetical protein